jgi:hypothetical protein
MEALSSLKTIEQGPWGYDEFFQIAKLLQNMKKWVKKSTFDSCLKSVRVKSGFDPFFG